MEPGAQSEALPPVAAGFEVQSSFLCLDQRVLDFQWSPDSRSIAFRSIAGAIAVKNVSNDDPPVVLAQASNAAKYAWSPSGSRFAITENSELTILDMGADVLPTPASVWPSCEAFAWLTDDLFVMFDGLVGVLFLCDMTKGEGTRLRFRSPTALLCDIVAVPGPAPRIGLVYRSRMEVWEYAGDKLRLISKMAFSRRLSEEEDFAEPVRTCAFSSRGDVAAIVSELRSREVQVFDWGPAAASQRCKGTLPK